MGTTLLKSVFRQGQYGQLDAAEQRRRDTLCNLAGYIAVVRALSAESKTLLVHAYRRACLVSLALWMFGSIASPVAPLLQEWILTPHLIIHQTNLGER